MNLTADENIDIEIIKSLRQEGHNVISIAEDFFGISDGGILDITNKNDSVLITADKDFGELVFRNGRAANGVILIRLFGIPQEEKAEIVVQLFKEHPEKLPGNFTVIKKNKIRIKEIS